MLECKQPRYYNRAPFSTHAMPYHTHYTTLTYISIHVLTCHIHMYTCMYLYFMKWTPPTQQLARKGCTLSFLSLTHYLSHSLHYRLTLQTPKPTEWCPTGRHGDGTCRYKDTKRPPEVKSQLTLSPARNGCTWWRAGTPTVLFKRSNWLVQHVHYHSYYNTTICATRRRTQKGIHVVWTCTFIYLTCQK